MDPVSPVMPGSEPIEIVLGKGQPKYTPLPVVYLSGDHRPMISRWRLNLWERAMIAAGADIVLTQLTWCYKFQPVYLQVCEPDEMPVLLDQEPR
jgi:hypothetical protein